MLWKLIQPFLKSMNELNSSEPRIGTVVLKERYASSYFKEPDRKFHQRGDVSLREVMELYDSLYETLMGIQRNFNEHWNCPTELTLVRLKMSVVKKREDILRDLKTACCLFNADEQEEVNRVCANARNKVEELSDLKKALWKMTAMNLQKDLQGYDVFIENFIRNAESYSIGYKRWDQ